MSHVPTVRTAAFQIPVLPHTSPEAPQPPNLKLPLYPHQLRALNRCLVIEEGNLSNDFGDRFDFTSRGGCLADEVGTGKTATSIGLVLSSSEIGETLVVAPSHLIPQWKSEIEKFTDAIEVIVGKAEYKKCDAPVKQRMVLIDVDTILNDQRLWYDFRRVFAYKDGPMLKVDPQKMEVYKKAALFSVKSPKGPCNYTGWLYTGCLHLTKRPWRRVILDEIQDLVAEGTESQKNLLQLTRTAKHVWLLSGTPFPHGNRSVYANHELLGFCRLRLNVEVNYKLPENHTFEIIKRKLYIKSPRHIAQSVSVANQVIRKTIQVPQLDIEQRFYELELKRVHPENPSFDEETLFSEALNPLREMTVHPEASQDLRDQMRLGQQLQSSSVSAVGDKALKAANHRLRQLENRDLAKVQQFVRNTGRSLELAKSIQKMRRNAPRAKNVFDGPVAKEQLKEHEEHEKAIIHAHYCGCPSHRSSQCYGDKHVKFRVVRDETERNTMSEFITGSITRLMSHFDTKLKRGNKVLGQFGREVDALNHYVTVTEHVYKHGMEELENFNKEQQELKRRIEVLSLTNSMGGTLSTTANPNLAETHGSKPAALIAHLREVVLCGEQVLVFSYWHDTLKLVQRTLGKVGLESAFCDGCKMEKALSDFTKGRVPILLLSAHSKASGANLQCATHVAILDPSGSSAEHGCALEQQAIGRAVRMGQDRPVTVTRFVVEGTLEEDLFKEIDKVAQHQAIQAQNDSQYVIQNSRHQAVVNPCLTGTNDDGDVQVTAAVSGEERLRREFQKAKEMGNVICIDCEDEGQAPEQEKLHEATSAIKVEGGKHLADDLTSPNQTKRQRLEVSVPPLMNSVTGHQNEAAVVSPSERECGPSTPSTGLVNNSRVRTSALKDMLRRFDLSDYESKFLEKGYDSVSWLQQVANDVVVMETLASSVGFKPGHAVRFQVCLTREAAAASKTSSHETI